MVEESKNYNYEELRKIHRKEKTSPELQQLDEDFYSQVAFYLKEKEELLEKMKKSDNKFSEDASEKIKTEISNIKSIVKDIYERREKKILTTAISSTRVDGQIDLINMLDCEEEIYNKIMKILENNRKDILEKALKGEGIENIKNLYKIGKEEQNKELVRVTNEVPEFKWKDGEVYGPF